MEIKLDDGESNYTNNLLEHCERISEIKEEVIDENYEMNLLFQDMIKNVSIYN